MTPMALPPFSRHPSALSAHVASTVDQSYAFVGHQVPQSASILEVALVYLRAAGTVNGYLFILTIHSSQFIIHHYKEKAAFIFST